MNTRAYNPWIGRVGPRLEKFQGMTTRPARRAARKLQIRQYLASNPTMTWKKAKRIFRTPSADHA